MPQKRTSSSKHHDLDSGTAKRRGGRKIVNYERSQPPAETSVTRARKSISSIEDSKRADELRTQLAAILELSQDAILSKTISGTITNWNKTAERIYGYRSDEILGKSVSTIFPPENLSELDEITERLKRGERIENYETVRIRKDGTRVEVALSFSPLTDRDGAPVGATVIARDITGRKRAEAETVYHANLLEVLNDAIFVTDENYRLTAWNKAAEELYGWNANEILGRNEFDIVKTEWPTAKTEAIRRAIAETGHWRGEGIQQRKDGTRFPSEVSTITLRNGKSHIAGYVSVNRDITDRKRTEDALIASESRYRRLFETAKDGILILDAETGMIVDVNPFLIQLLGYPKESFLGTTLWELGKFKDIASNKENFLKLHEKEYIRYDNLPLETANGLRKNVEFVSNVYQENHQKVIQCNIRDITERKRAEQQIQNQLDRMAALREIDIAICGNFDIRVTLKILLQQVTKQLHVDAADILLLNPNSLMLTFGAGTGFNTRAVELTQLRLGDPFAGRVALEQTLISIPDLGSADTPPQYGELLRAEKFVSYIGVPLIAKGQVMGVLEILHREPLHPDNAWLDFLHALAGQAAIALDSTGLFDNLQRSNANLVIAYENTIEGWSRALDLRDKETEGHTQRVTEFTLKLAREAGVTDAELTFIRRGALLHDIGKMGVPDAILLKPGPLTDEEWTVMRKHPGFAYDLLSPIKYLAPAMDIPYCHHEKWDGSGYPRGLKGEQIPLAARLFAVVDVWDALNSDRPYRPAWQKDKILDHIRSLSGTHFDPYVVNVFFKMQAPSH